MNRQLVLWAFVLLGTLCAVGLLSLHLLGTPAGIAPPTPYLP